jgi:hypothetical protein
MVLNVGKNRKFKIPLNIFLATPTEDEYTIHTKKTAISDITGFICINHSLII